jgi:hypothetical protein
MYVSIASVVTDKPFTRGGAMRSRTVTFTRRDGEVARDQLTKTDSYCVRCGTRGVWTTCDGWHICSTCRTVMPEGERAFQPEPGSPHDQIAKALGA